MKKLIVSCMLAVAMCSVYAQTIDVSKLTQEQVTALSKQVQELAGNPVTVSAQVRSEASAWGELGANMGKAMVGAAKEIGVAANEFSQTSLGKVVVFMTVYKIMGRELLGVIVGSGIMLFTYSLALWLLATKRWSTVTYTYVPVLFGAFTLKKILDSKISDDVLFAKVMTSALLLVFSTLIGLNVIF